jgi:hypothetical protein
MSVHHDQNLCVQNALRKLFYRIDANCDGTVDWDEFSLYMLLEQQGAAEIIESENRRELKAPISIAKVNSSDAHSKIIDCCTLIPPCGGSGPRYATGARDGTVKFWSPEVRMLRPTARCNPAWCGCTHGEHLQSRYMCTS